MADIRFQYFSVAVRDLDEGIERYGKYFGLKPVGEVKDQRWGFKGVMLGTDEGAVLELISPVAEDSALKRFMDMREGDAYPKGEGLYLVGLQVDELEARLQQVEAAGGRITREGESPNLGWVHPLSNGNVMVELIARPTPEANEA
jgi:catechol 2,3-dioxygenase-like lactoylglutathione lyase family enzyme